MKLGKALATGVATEAPIVVTAADELELPQNADESAEPTVSEEVPAAR